MKKKKFKKGNNSSNSIYNFIVALVSGILVFITLISIFSFSVINFNINKNFFALIISFIIILSSFFGALLLSAKKIAIKSLILSFVIFLCFFLLSLFFEDNQDMIKIVLMLPVSLIAGLLAAILKNKRRKI